MMYPIACLRLLAFVVGGIILVSAHCVYYSFTRSLAVTRYWHKFSCFVFGIHVHSYGEALGQRNKETGINLPVLYTANHLSYIDICALGSLLDTLFVSKDDVRSWPLIGFMAQLHKTVFIRRVRTAMEQALKDAQNRLDYGYDLVVFPEGTSSNGERVLPFKPGLFELAYTATARKLTVQPIAIVIEGINGTPPATQPENSQIRNLYAWWRPEDEFLPHLWQLACVWRTDIGVHFLAPLDPQNFDDRKTLSDAAHAAIAQIIDAQNPVISPSNVNVPVAQQDRATVS